MQSEKLNGVCRCIPILCRSIKESYESIKMLKLRTASDAYFSYKKTCGLGKFCNEIIIQGVAIKDSVENIAIKKAFEDNGGNIALLEGIEKSIEQMGIYKNSISEFAKKNMHIVIQIELDAFCIENKIEDLPNRIQALLVEMVLEM